MERTPVVVAALVLALASLQISDGQLSPGDRCSTQDPVQLSYCLSWTLEKLRPFFRTGVPERNIPPGDPLLLNEISFADEGLDVKYSTVVVKGFSDFTLNSLNVDPAARTINFNLSVPELSIAGDYDVVGSFLVLRVTSRGNFSSDIKDVVIAGAGDLVIQTGSSDGQTHLQMSNLRVNLKIGETYHRVDFSPDTHPVIGKTVRHLVTKNDRVLLREVWPEIEAKVAEVMSRLVNQVLTVIPVDEIVSRPGQPQPAAHDPSLGGAFVGRSAI